MEILQLRKIPLTKAAEAIRNGSGTPWEALGIDAWVVSPAMTEIVPRYPGLVDDLRRELGAAFSPDGRVDLSALLAFPGDTCEEGDIRYEDILQMKPFETFGSPGRDHVLIFLDHIEPKLCSSLPTEVHGLHVNPGDWEQVFLIPADTLSGTDLEDLALGDAGTDQHDQMQDILTFLSRAKREQADVVATIG